MSGLVRVAGVDLSLTSTGIARVTVDGSGAAALSTHTQTIGSTGHAGASLTERSWRITQLAIEVMDAVRSCDVVMVEGASYQSKYGNAHERAGAWWDVVNQLIGLGKAVIEVTPTSVKVYATGNGAATKVDVVRNVRSRYGRLFDIPRGTGADDIADAVTLAAMGARWAGHPIDDLPALHLRTLPRVKWPTTQPMRGIQ